MKSKVKKSPKEIQKRLKEISEVVERVIKEEKLEKNIKSVSVFGSVVRGEETKDSDIDFFVEFLEPLGLSFFTFQIKLEDNFSKKVDLGTKNSLDPYLKKNIINSSIKIYER